MQDYTFVSSSKIRLAVYLVILMIASTSCNETPIPKPRGYIRIDLPEKRYTTFDSCYPFRFEYPVYAHLTPDTSRQAMPFWLNMNFGQMKATLFLSYKPIKKNELATYLEDNHLFLSRHIAKSNGIEELRIENRNSRIFGTLYNINGTGAASPIQFFLTDSTHHFVRGALYFNFTPNNDSLRPVIEFLNSDLIHMVETFRWQNPVN